MKRVGFAALACLLTFIPTMFGIAGDLKYAAPKTVDMSSDRLDTIDTIVEGAIESGNIPHGAVLVARKGKIVYEKYFGYADVETQAPLQSDTIFRVASMTKAVTSVAAMICFEEGKYEMNDRLSKYIPAFEGSQIAVVSEDGTTFTTRDPVRPITVRDVLVHRAGMIYQPFFTGPLSDLYLQEGVAEIFPFRRDESLEAYVNRYASLPMYTDPGGEITYGVATDVLGRLVEVWSGQSLAEFFEERIFSPLGMEDTSFFLPDGSDKIDRLTTMYEAVDPTRTDVGFQLNTSPEVGSEFTGPRKLYCGAAGLLSTPTDYFRFCEMIRNGGKWNGARILSHRAIDMMTSNQLGNQVVPDFLRILGDQTGFGLGVRTMHGEWDGLESLGTLTFAGIYWTRYWIDPKEDLVILAFTQAYIFDQSGWTHKVKNAAFAAIEQRKPKQDVAKR